MNWVCSENNWYIVEKIWVKVNIGHYSNTANEIILY